MSASTVNSPEEITLEIAVIDSQIKELAEMLPFANPLTRIKFLDKIDHCLDARLDLMERR